MSVASISDNSASLKRSFAKSGSGPLAARRAVLLMTTAHSLKTYSTVAWRWSLNSSPKSSSATSAVVSMAP